MQESRGTTLLQICVKVSFVAQHLSLGSHLKMWLQTDKCRSLPQNETTQLRQVKTLILFFKNKAIISLTEQAIDLLTKDCMLRYHLKTIQLIEQGFCQFCSYRMETAEYHLLSIRVLSVCITEIQHNEIFSSVDSKSLMDFIRHLVNLWQEFQLEYT